MKRQTQTTGIRNWYGNDFLSLQEEGFKVLDGFFAQFGSFILAGCQVTAHDGKYDISPGLVVLAGSDDDGQATKMVVPFDGIAQISLPVYLTLGCETVTDTYEDGGVKPIAQDYKAVASAVQPEGNYLIISQAEVFRFVDAIQDARHRFVTDTDRANWNGKENPDAAQQKADDALASAKNYADQLIAQLIDRSPETLDTFRELAEALGNDPNFATTILTKLGQKAQALSPYEIIESDMIHPVGGKTYFPWHKEIMITTPDDPLNDFSMAADKSLIVVEEDVKVVLSRYFFVSKNIATGVDTNSRLRVYTIRAISVPTSYPPYKFVVDCDVYYEHDEII